MRAGLRRGGIGGEIYRLLKNPIRREIISLLYTRGELTATQLKLLLNISYGTLYYHLDFLKPLIDQVGRGRYRLNHNGILIAERMFKEIGAEDQVMERRPLPLGILERAAASPSRYALLGAMASALYLFMSNTLPIKPVLLHLKFQESGGLISATLSMFLVIVYFMVAGLIAGRRGGFGGILTICLISYLPVDLYLLMLFSIDFFGLKLNPLTPLLQGGFIAVHLVQLVILAGALTHSKGLGWEKSLPISLLLSYISLLLSGIL